MVLDYLVGAVSQPLALPLMAVSSGTYFYPLRGLLYYIRHPILWGSLIAMILPQVLLTIVVFTLAYLFLYPPQAAMAILFNGPTGLFTAWIAMIQQSIALTQLFSAMFLMPTPLRLMFDAILSSEGHDRLVLAGKLRPQGQESDQRKITGFVKKIPKNILWPKWAYKIFIHLTLNFIPVVGPITLIFLDATDVATRCQSRYFELKGYDRPESKNYVRSRRGQYFAFGVVAAALEAIPFVGVAFMFTNTAGGALWAVDVEKRLGLQTYKPRKSRIRFFLD